MGDVAGKVTTADTVRFIKRANDTKDAGEGSVWHSFSVRSTVQNWLNGTANDGIVVKASDETLGRGGPAYQASEYRVQRNGRPSAHQPAQARHHLRAARSHPQHADDDRPRPAPR